MNTIFIWVIFAGVLLEVLGFEHQPDVPHTSHNLPTNPAYYTNYQPYWSTYQAKPFEEPVQCNHEISDEIFTDYRHAFYDMSTVMYKRIAAVKGAHFVYSPQTTWLTMAAMAEGTTGPTRQQMFRFLNLPEDICPREAYYYLASTREHTDTDIVFARNRFFVADSSIHVNKQWEEYARTHADLNTVSVPYKPNPAVEIEELKKLFHVHLPNINLSGNSLILESLDYTGLWTSVFSDAVIEEGPFYNSYGKQIGVLDYMKVSKRANIGLIPSLNMKIIDLPVGREGRYRMYFTVSLSPNDNYEETLAKIENSLVIESLANLKESLEPVEIVIPKIKVTSELDMRQLLEDVGIKSLWTDPLATRNISEPAALPSAYIQRVSVNIDDSGVRPAVHEYQNFVPPLNTYPGHSEYSGYQTASWSDIKYSPLELSSFVANKPFMFGLFDSISSVGLMYGSFSKMY